MTKLAQRGIIFDQDSNGDVAWGSTTAFPTKEAFIEELAGYCGFQAPIAAIDTAYLRWTVNAAVMFDDCDHGPHDGVYLEVECSGRGHSPVWRCKGIHRFEDTYDTSLLELEALGEQ